MTINNNKKQSICSNTIIHSGTKQVIIFRSESFTQNTDSERYWLVLLWLRSQLFSLAELDKL